jgi:hypothetical protein
VNWSNNYQLMSASPKFTPGPWRVTKDHESLNIWNSTGSFVASLELRPESPALGLCSQTREKNKRRNAQSRTDAKLIAAAPELYEALEAVMDEFNDRYDGAPDAGYQWMASLIHQIEHALALAR